LSWQTGALSRCRTVVDIDIATQCLNVDLCGYLVELDVLDTGDAWYVIIDTSDACNAMDGRGLAIVDRQLSTGTFDLHLVSPDGGSFLSRAILRRHIAVVDPYLDSGRNQVSPMKSRRRVLCTAALSCRGEVTEWLLRLGPETSSPFNTMESVHEAILGSPECAEAWSLFLDTRLHAATCPTLLFVKTKGAVKSMTSKRVKHCVSTMSVSSHLELTDMVRFRASNSCFGSVKPPKCFDWKPSREAAGDGEAGHRASLCNRFNFFQVLQFHPFWRMV
jgi:hypothetical protein